MYRFKVFVLKLYYNNQEILYMYNVHNTVYKSRSIKYLFKNYFSNNLK